MPEIDRVIRSAATADAAQIAAVMRDSWRAAYDGIIATEIINRVTAPDGGARVRQSFRTRPWQRMLVAVAAFWKWWGTHRREPDEISKMIIGSFFTIAGGLCLFMAALTQPAGGKISLFWPMLFELCNSIGFAHVLPISLALFSKIAPKQITATVIGLYYLAFFIAHAVVGYVGGLYSTLPTTTFWLIHVASAAFGLVAFVLFKIVIGHRMQSAPEDQARALS